MEYVVSAITSPFGEPVGNPLKTKNPEEAIIKWCELSQTYPTCVSIQADSEETGIKLLKWAGLNRDKMDYYLSIYRCPYKPEWVMDQITSQINNNKTSMQWAFDELFPFCMG